MAGGEGLGDGEGPGVVVACEAVSFCGSGKAVGVHELMSLSVAHWLEPASMTPWASSLKNFRLSLSTAVQSPGHLAR